MKYRISVDYATCGVVTIEAKDFTEALEKAEHVSTREVTEKEYIDGSWNVNREMSEEFCIDDTEK